MENSSEGRERKWSAVEAKDGRRDKKKEFAPVVSLENAATPRPGDVSACFHETRPSADPEIHLWSTLWKRESSVSLSSWTNWKITPTVSLAEFSELIFDEALGGISRLLKPILT